jgi:hypothetical protein
MAQSWALRLSSDYYKLFSRLKYSRASVAIVTLTSEGRRGFRPVNSSGRACAFPNIERIAAIFLESGSIYEVSLYIEGVVRGRLNI